MPKDVLKTDVRTPEEIKQHYLIEKELAARLRAASKDERRRLYSDLYNELFKRVPSFPQMVLKQDPEAQKQSVQYQAGILSSFIKPETVFLEIGAGDCGLSFRMAQHVNRVYAVEVSDEITKTPVSIPSNLRLIISDGVDIPLEDGSIDVAYSNQMFEHLHPDDAVDQLNNVFRILKPGGIFICITPNRLTGPYDISAYFENVATCFHLKEYTAYELARLFRKTGFSKIRILLGGNKEKPILVTPWTVGLIELVLRCLPFTVARAIALRLPISTLRNIIIVGMR